VTRRVLGSRRKGKKVLDGVLYDGTADSLVTKNVEEGTMFITDGYGRATTVS
jgi:hypothetical protein